VAGDGHKGFMKEVKASTSSWGKVEAGTSSWGESMLDKDATQCAMVTNLG